MGQLKYLFQPTRIGQMEVGNRVLMPGMSLGFGYIDEDRCVTPQYTAYFAERAKSRPGMIILASTLVHPSALETLNVPRIPLWDDRVSHGLEELVKAVRNYGVKFGIQLAQVRGTGSGGESIGASAVPPIYLPDAKAMEISREAIKELVEAYGNAAQRGVKAGFDFVEVNASAEYILSEFLTPYYNRRADEYGGSFDNRIRFLIEVIREVTRKVGHEVPIGVKVNGDDLFPEGGWTLPEACRLAPILEREGVSYLHISAGQLGAPRWYIPSMYEEQGVFVYLSAEVKKHTALPVVALGRIKNPIMADRIIGEGKADLVDMGRAHLADPEIVEKARKGEIADIRPCIAECRGCLEPLARDPLHGGASCAVNPRLGREYLVKDVEGEKRTTPKKVLVAGAGCAGLEAARRAAFAGHRVLLCESKGRIGGQLRLAAMMPKRSEIGDILPWYERQLNKLGVEIRLNTKVGEDSLDQIRPDVLVVATGSLPEVPLGYIEGLANLEHAELLLVDELLEEERLTGESVLVLGGDQIGLQVADYLAEKGEKVYVVEKSAQLAGKMAVFDSTYLIGRVINEGVKLYTNVQKVEILPTDEVWIVNDGGKERLPEINTIVLASDRRPDVLLAEVAKRKGIETYIIGDSSGVNGEDQGTVLMAIAAGYDIGRQI
jgi:2,4-dienoyl-CoA reductase-like NADH-dependent reductase (Old Yellow Enzyme family)/ribulose 1,5-bisphosphate synthetase/thiazole synthase